MRKVPQRVLEAALEQYFRNSIRKIGGKVVKLAPTEVGVPDRLVLLPGGVVELVELKTDTGTLSLRQRVWHDQAAALGTTVHVLRGRAAVDAFVRGYFSSVDKRASKR